MELQQAKQQAEQLREQIEYYSKLYYEKDDPAISDYEFDQLMHRLIDLEEQFPELLTPDSPTHRVGGRASNSFAPVEHLVQMGSLQDVFSSEEVREFDQKVRQQLEHPLYVVEPKIDGLSVSLEYAFEWQDHDEGDSDKFHYAGVCAAPPEETGLWERMSPKTCAPSPPSRCA